MINPRDSVAMLLEDGKKGDTIQTPKGEITLQEDVEFAHKVSIVDMAKGQSVIKYGEEIGFMLQQAPAGTWIHVHNMGCTRGKK
jgi:hypothetical protein